MELYLIRHGETVDNVAGLYAGVRDSALTVHGVEQARRLGSFFAKHDVLFSRIFSSPLSRALKTAQALNAAHAAAEKELEITIVSELIEQDFGYYEGRPFHARSGPKKTGREAHRDQHKSEPGFIDVESKESMNKRADTFIDHHLMPLFSGKHKSAKGAIAIVSHGMLLSHLWRRILLRLPSQSVTVAPEVIAARGSIILQHLGGWSNTGYLELALTQPSEAVVAEDEATPKLTSTVAAPTPQYAAASASSAADNEAGTSEEISNVASSGPAILKGWSTLIRAVDRKDHLTGLKRQRGGIGRTAHDEGQKKLDGFFKKQRTS